MDNTVKMTTLVKTDNKIPPDKSKFGVLDIVLRGGSPWGFALQGGRETRSPLTVSKVDPEGKAGKEMGLKIGDYILSINHVQTTSHTEAVQLIRDAFTTLTMSVARGAFETPKGSTADPGKDGSYRTSSQDDSVVYNESKTKGAIKHRPSRRGDSFNIRASNNRSTWQSQDGDPESPGRRVDSSVRSSKRSSQGPPSVPHSNQTHNGVASTKSTMLSSGGQQIHNAKSTPVLYPGTGGGDALRSSSSAWGGVGSSTSSLQGYSGPADISTSSQSTYSLSSNQFNSSSQSVREPRSPFELNKENEQPFRVQSSLELRSYTQDPPSQGHFRGNSQDSSLAYWTRQTNRGNYENVSPMDTSEPVHLPKSASMDMSSSGSNGLHSPRLSGGHMYRRSLDQTSQSTQELSHGQWSSSRSSLDSGNPPQPPTRDASSMRYRQLTHGSFTSDQDSLISPRSQGSDVHSPGWTEPPVPDLSPHHSVSTPSHHMSTTSPSDLHSSQPSTTMNTSRLSPKHNAYIVRQTPYYNTSTQTEQASQQTSTDMATEPEPVKQPATMVDNAVQVRVESLINNVYQRNQLDNALALHDTKKEGPDPQMDPNHHRTASIMDHMEHFKRIPETIREDTQEDPGKMEGVSSQDMPPPPTSPSAFNNSSTQKQKLPLNESALKQIHDHSPSQTFMLRKLSQEFYGRHQTKRPSMGAPRRSMDEPRQARPSDTNTSQEITAKPVTKAWSQEPSIHVSKHEKGDSGFCSREASQDQGAWQDVSKPQLDTTAAQVKVNQPEKSAFDRTNRYNMSMRKAIGTFDDVGLAETKLKLLVNQGKSTPQINETAEPAPVTTKPHKSRRSLDGSKHKSKKGDPDYKEHKEKKKKERGVKRVTSEQIRPAKSAEKEAARATKDKDKRRYSDPKPPHDKQHKTSDPTEYQSSGVPHHLSVEGGNQSNKRLSTGSDSVFHDSSIERQKSKLQGRSVSSSSMDETAVETRRQQHHSLPGHYNSQKGNNRLSASSVTSSLGETFTQDYQGRRSFQPSQSDMVAARPGVYRDPVRSVSTSQLQRLASEGGSSMGDMSPPVLLTSNPPFRSDLSSPATPTSPSTDYSPPMHPWTADSTKNPLTMKQRSRSLGETQLLQDTSPSHDVTMVTDPDETIVKAPLNNTHTSSSNTLSPGGQSETSSQSSYQVTVNRTYTDEEEAAPVLPPRNYRTASGEWVAQPPTTQTPTTQPPTTQPPASTNNSSSNFQRSSTGDSSSNFQRSSIGELSTSQSFTSEIEEPDYYADQLRAQAQKIRQSQRGSARNFKTKAVPETRTSVSSSRPVDKPPVAQEAKQPAPIRRYQQVPSLLNLVGLPDGQMNPPDKSPSPQPPALPDEGPPQMNGDFTRGDGLSLDSARLSQASSHSAGSHHSPQGSLSSHSHSSHGTLSSQVVPVDGVSPPPPPPHARPLRHKEDRPLPPPPPEAAADQVSRHLASEEKSPQIDRVSSGSDIAQVIDRSPQGQDPDRTSQGQDRSPQVTDRSPTLPDTAPSYSSESYMHNRQRTRQGFAGNYKRNDEMASTKIGNSPGFHNNQESSPMPEYSAGSPQHARGGWTGRPVPQGNGTAKVGPPEVPAKPKREPPWASRPQPQLPVSPSSARKPHNEQAETHRTSHANTTQSAGDHFLVRPARLGTDHGYSSGEREDEPVERPDSPSVKAFVANFEQKDWGSSPRLERSQTSVSARGKVSELRENLLRRSNENLLTISDSSSNMVIVDTDISDRISNSRLVSSDCPRQSPPGVPTHREPLFAPGVPPHRDPLPPRKVEPAHRDPLPPRKVDINVTHYTHPVVPETSSSPTVAPSHKQNGSSPISVNHSRTTTGGGSQRYDRDRAPSPPQHPPPPPPVSTSPEMNSSKPTESSLRPPCDTPPSDTTRTIPMIHQRQKSHEEIECEKVAEVVAHQIRDHDKELSEVILPPADRKTTTDFMTGLFDISVGNKRRPSRGGNLKDCQLERRQQPDGADDNSSPQASRSEPMALPSDSSYWSPSGVASLQNKMRQEGLSVDDMMADIPNTSLDTQKAELISRIEKKLATLKEEETMLVDEVTENAQLGKEVTAVVESKVTDAPMLRKYHLYVDELDKVMRLLLKLSGRLARAQNACMTLPPDSSPHQKSTLNSKRDELLEKHEDAKQLKEGIDRRSPVVSACLKEHLTPEEFADYQYFIKMKSKLTMDRQEIEDKIKLGTEQLSALKDSLDSSLA